MCCYFPTYSLPLCVCVCRGVRSRPPPYRGALSWHGDSREESTAVRERSQPLSAARLAPRSVYFQQGRLIRASSCQRFVSAPLLSPKPPLPAGSQELRQMNTFKSNSTPTDNSFTASPPAPLGGDMLVLCLIPTTPGAQYGVWPRLRMWRLRSSHGPLETTCTLQSRQGEEPGRTFTGCSTNRNNTSTSEGFVCFHIYIHPTTCVD